MRYLTVYLETTSGRIVEFEVQASYIPEYSERHDDWGRERFPARHEIEDIYIDGKSCYKRMKKFCPKRIDEIEEQINQDL